MDPNAFFRFVALILVLGCFSELRFIICCWHVLVMPLILFRNVKL